MRHKTRHGRLGGPSILVGWVFFAPVMILWMVAKGLRNIEWK